MNKVILSGRLTKDPEVKHTNSGVAVCSFTIAVDRRFKNNNGERLTDFVPCVAWRQQATLLGQYFHKGSRIAIVGEIQTRKYDAQDGSSRTVTEVNIEEIEFVDTKSESNNAKASAAPAEPEFDMRPVPPMPTAKAAPVPEPSFEADDSVALPFDLEGFNV